MHIDQAFCDISVYAVREYALRVRVNIHAILRYLDLVHDSLHISVSIHLYIRTYTLYICTRKWQSFAIATTADSV